MSRAFNCICNHPEVIKRTIKELHGGGCTRTSCPCTDCDRVNLLLSSVCTTSTGARNLLRVEDIVTAAVPAVTRSYHSGRNKKPIVFKAVAADPDPRGSLYAVGTDSIGPCRMAFDSRTGEPECNCRQGAPQTAADSRRGKHAVAVDQGPQGFVYVMDGENCAIELYHKRHFGGAPVQTWNGAKGPTRFSPQAMTVQWGAAGFVLIVDGDRGCILALDKNGTLQREFSLGAAEIPTYIASVPGTLRVHVAPRDRTSANSTYCNVAYEFDTVNGHAGITGPLAALHAACGITDMAVATRAHTVRHLTRNGTLRVTRERRRFVVFVDGDRIEVISVPGETHHLFTPWHRRPRGVEEGAPVPWHFRFCSRHGWRHWCNHAEDPPTNGCRCDWRGHTRTRLVRTIRGWDIDAFASPLCVTAAHGKFYVVEDGRIHTFFLPRERSGDAARRYPPARTYRTHNQWHQHYYDGFWHD